MKRMLIPVILFLMIVSCSKNESMNYPDCGVSQEHMNKQISVIHADKNNEIHHSITVVVKNNTKKEILTSWDFDVEIFSFDYSNHEWARVNNDAIYLGDDIYNDELLEKRFFSFGPDIPITQQKARIYVCVFGRIVESDELVGASSEFFLN